MCFVETGPFSGNTNSAGPIVHLHFFLRLLCNSHGVGLNCSERRSGIVLCKY